MIKKNQLILLAAGLCLLPVSLSSKSSDDNQNSEIGVVIGGNFPINKYSGRSNSSSNLLVGLNYSNYSNKGLGFKTGLQYMPEVNSVSHFFGIPFAVSYRTEGLDWNKRMRNGIDAFDRTLTEEMEEQKRYYSDGKKPSVLGSAFFMFLASMFSDVEFYAGITPGFIAGKDKNDTVSPTPLYQENGKTYWEKTYTSLNSRFSTSLDAGLNLNYNIWRFGVKIMPAFHYNITDNYLIHNIEGNSLDGETKRTTLHQRWYFSICGGISFCF